MVTVMLAPVDPMSGVKKHRSRVAFFWLTRLTMNMRPALPDAAGSVTVTPVFPVPAALQNTMKSVLGTIV